MWINYYLCNNYYVHLILILIDTSQSSIDEKYPTPLLCSKYQFKKIALQVFGRNLWKTNVQRDTDSETLPDLILPVPTGNVQPKVSCTEGI